jgi:hypothetical protein
MESSLLAQRLRVMEGLIECISERVPSIVMRR